MVKNDINVFGEKPKPMQQTGKQFFSQSDIHNLPDKSIPQRTLEANLIFFGLAADRPTGETHIKCWFSFDTNTLNIWNGTAWVQEVLS